MKWKNYLIAILILLIILLAGFTVWGSTPLGPTEEALQSMVSDKVVQVDTEPWLIFRPAGVTPSTGLILYPGGRVDYRSYAPPARAIAQENFLVVIPPMPLNLAVFGIDRAGEIIDAFPEIDRWAIGGHSLGGAMAARYALLNPDLISGLALWAAYPANSDNLSSYNLHVVSVYGSEDQVASQDSLDSSRALLPMDTEWVLINGGNHAQFGSYGPQPGDGKASISSAVQQNQVVRATISMLRSLE